MPMGKGDRYERKLVGQFSDAAWFVIRAPASGAATNNCLPDVLAAKDGHVLVMELKFNAEDNIYLSAEEVEALMWCAKKLQGHAYCVARWKGDTTFYGFAPHQCDRTDSGKFVMRRKERDEALVIPPTVTGQTAK